VAVLTAPAGAVVARQVARANVRGYREALRIAEQYAPGGRAWAIGRTRNYGAASSPIAARQR
jgi:hypothetical protein